MYNKLIIIINRNFNRPLELGVLQQGFMLLTFYCVLICCGWKQQHPGGTVKLNAEETSWHCESA